MLCLSVPLLHRCGTPLPCLLCNLCLPHVAILGYSSRSEESSEDIISKAEGFLQEFKRFHSSPDCIPAMRTTAHWIAPPEGLFREVKGVSHALARFSCSIDSVELIFMEEVPPSLFHLVAMDMLPG
ncbi:hypothetical protein GH714_007664 [Hevea brasiliensis]|uniref:Uncharacterized protein n=1 Tax=Hevea brasiliensis TaxID=3981 RepID=A0A6A6M018_HEVBR|nr:hypothetical protein GH714_007664 [Hevea brasiliensis]